MNHIALILPSLRGGGAEKVALILADWLTRKGYSVDLVVVTSAGSLRKLVPDGVRVVDLSASRAIASVSKLAQYFRSVHPSAAIAFMHHMNVVAKLAQILSGQAIRVLMSVHAHVGYSISQRKSPIHRFTPLWSAWFYRRADAVIAVSDAVADDLAVHMRMARSKITTIYNPVISPVMFHLANEPLEDEWLEDTDIPLIVASGRLTPLKDFPTLIRAFAHIQTVRPSKLLILGEGPMRDELQRLINEQGLNDIVKLWGFVDNPYKFYKRASVLAATSKAEGFGNVLIEALALGTQVVSTDAIGAPREILQNGLLGRLVPVGDVRALSAAIAEAIEVPLPIKAELLQPYKVEKAAQRYVELLTNG